MAAPDPLPTETATGARPDIPVFLSDDMGWSQPGFNGGREVPTPSMDRIASEGVKLTQFYVQPVCSPTRASLLTGLPGLTAPRADRNRIADLWPLARLAGLEALELGANRVLDLNPLAGLTRLRALRLEDNGLKELYPLAGWMP